MRMRYVFIGIAGLVVAAMIGAGVFGYVTLQGQTRDARRSAVEAGRQVSDLQAEVRTLQAQVASEDTAALQSRTARLEGDERALRDSVTSVAETLQALLASGPSDLGVRMNSLESTVRVLKRCASDLYRVALLAETFETFYIADCGFIP
jgi:Sec-independent protein translocase protein TatA